LASSRRVTLVEGGLLVVGLLVLFVLLPHELMGDDFTRFDDVERLIHHGELSDSRFSLVMPLFSAPVLLIGEVVRTPEWWAARFNVILVAVASLAILFLLRGRGDLRNLRRSLLILLFASFLTNRLRDYNAEVLTATLVTLGLVLVATRRRSPVGWAAIVLGVVNTPAALGAAALVAGAEALRARRLRYLVVPVAAAVLIMTEAWIRRGGPLTTGYAGDHGLRTILPYSGRSGFSYPFLFGVLSILFSLGRGLLFFMPGLALAATRRTWDLIGARRLVLLMLVFVSGLVLVYAKWWAWYGGLSWGPRFFLFAAIPASVLLAVRVCRPDELGFWDNALTLLVLVLSGWVGVAGATADLSTLDFCVRQHASLEALCWYTAEFSPLWHPLVDFPALTWKTAAVAGYCALVFAYVAAPLLVAILRALRATVPTRAWAAGWRL
jgi:hypothetical protein